MSTFRQEFDVFARSARSGGRLRLAPTPSGFLHPGNALNFILNWLVARLVPSGNLLLRIDDLDADRKRPEYVQDVFDTLRWLEIDWEEGPVSAADFEQNWSQHGRVPLYDKLLADLREKKHLFACGKSRRELAPYGGAYPPEFRNQNLSFDVPGVAWRIVTPPDFPLPDFIVRRRDGLPAYQVASLADDLHFGITHVIRGEDLRDSTAAQQFLAECAGRPDFGQIRFLHHPLVKNAVGEKLSKSAGADSLKAMRESGMSPEPVFQSVARLLGLPEQPFPRLRDLLAALHSDSGSWRNEA